MVQVYLKSHDFANVLTVSGTPSFADPDITGRSDTLRKVIRICSLWLRFS